MRLVKSTINDRTGAGTVTLYPTEPEDLWHTYNLLRPGDTLTAPALRKVVTAPSDEWGDTLVKTVRTSFSIKVKPMGGVDFDPQDGQLHVNGTICEQNPYAEVGQHHTLDLELHRQFALGKPGFKEGDGDSEGWDSVALETLKEATDVKRKAQTYAVVMEQGLANICLLTEHQTVMLQRAEVPVPKKGNAAQAAGHDKALQKFYTAVLEALLRHLDIKGSQGDGGSPPPLVLASPGFTAQSLHKHMIETASRNNDKILGAYARDSVIVAHSSTGHVHSLNEAITEKAVMNKLSDTRFVRESQLMEKLKKLLREDEDRAWYGPREVERAVEKGAVGKGGGVLLISDKLFRSDSIAERRRWVGLVDRVRKDEGGEVRVLSSQHQSGKDLGYLAGIAAILTFPLQDLEESDEDEDEMEQTS